MRARGGRSRLDFFRFVSVRSRSLVLPKTPTPFLRLRKTLLPSPKRGGGQNTKYPPAAGQKGRQIARSSPRKGEANRSLFAQRRKNRGARKIFSLPPSEKGAAKPSPRKQQKTSPRRQAKKGGVKPPPPRNDKNSSSVQKHGGEIICQNSVVTGAGHVWRFSA